MAGIGFELRKILKEDTYSSYVKSFFSSLVFISGPWIVTIISFLFLYAAIKNDYLKYFVMFTHIMAYALIITSPVQASVTRYISDLEFSKKEKEIFPVLTGVVVLSAFIGVILSSIIVYFSGIGKELSFFVFAFIVSNTIFWPLSAFTSLLKDYKKLTFVFFMLMLLSTVFIYFSFDILGGNSIFFFYSLSYFLIEFYIILSVFKEYNSTENISFRFLPNIVRSPMIWIPGVFYIMGMWVDKFVFWFFSPKSLSFYNIFRYNSEYDINFFLASVFVIPTLSIITIKSETSLATSFSEFTKNLVMKKGIRDLRISIRNIENDVRDGVGIILKYHGMLAIGLIFFSEYLFRFIENIHVFKILTIGILLQALFIFQVMVLYYLDSRKRLLIVNSLLFFTNGILSYFTISHPSYYGTGFSLSLILVNLIAYYFVREDVKDLNFLMFERELKR
ncbi:MAG: hypothetical protein C0601_10805 [Candidatus Muiribacterium halophilum]|uniref:Polysaccharide biosynthesis protein C-terminal domain-containing protein n=1 Tax=Muiribacterium halophilum TaxID=2053465 RepID=A0A2N5ZBQ3_MUIH1|nr:MAG: hypothetical protein C0601_10805 [Candidatus Muirbacterium halophilum]